MGASSMFYSLRVLATGNPCFLLSDQWGTSHPVEYEYDAQGRRTAMTKQIRLDNGVRLHLCLQQDRSTHPASFANSQNSALAVA